MSSYLVSLVRYTTPLASVKKAVETCNGLDRMPSGAKVFIKPNIVFWTKAVPFPKWGVVTTSRVVHDMVLMLKELGVQDITIGEGTVVLDPKDRETQSHAYMSLGYNELEKRYGVKLVNVFERPFRKIEIEDGVALDFNVDVLNSDFLVNLPVLKTHAQTVVSLGLKNVKGTINVNSRKKCHDVTNGLDLHGMVSRLHEKLPPSLTLIDGIFSLERGPGFDGKARRTDLLIASGDMLSADLVGAKVLGYDATRTPHIAQACDRRGRPLDLSDIEIRGERLDDATSHHEYAFEYNEANTLPLPMEKMGISGIAYPKYDLTLCTYCSLLNGAIIASIAYAWKGKPWPDVEVLTGKLMKPSEGKKTVLVGKCLYAANKDHPGIDDMLVVKTCPPSPRAVLDALDQAGVKVDPSILLNLDGFPGASMKKYKGKAEFDDAFFRIDA
ncbi:MAG: DUF362 domain-containing protein [Pseudomonadota bacterium]